ncbi:MAG: PspC domain-containing protein, partial [Acidimicrobiia bacterium]
MNQPVRTLRRLPQEKKVAGVCAGLARYAGVD